VIRGHVICWRVWSDSREAEPMWVERVTAKPRGQVFQSPEAHPQLQENVCSYGVIIAVTLTLDKAKGNVRLVPSEAGVTVALEQSGRLRRDAAGGIEPQLGVSLQCGRSAPESGRVLPCAI
jgi:hypothetical protein